MTDRYNVIVIGSGDGGGTLAHTLAQTGKKILILERGNFLPREMANWEPGTVFVDGKYISPDTWDDEQGRSFQPQVHYFLGGATSGIRGRLSHTNRGSSNSPTTWPLPGSTPSMPRAGSPR